MNMHQREWTVRLIALLLNLGPLSSAFPQNKAQPNFHDSPKTRITKVFLSVAGDPKLSHRLWTFIEFELEDAGIIIVNSEREADALISGEVNVLTTKHYLALGILRATFKAGGTTDKIESCGSMNSDEAGDVFSQSAGGMVDKIREKYPKARTVSVDAKSNTKESDTFDSDLANYLNKSGLELSDSSEADITVHLELVRYKIAVEEKELKYEITVLPTIGSGLSTQRGGGVISANALDRAPEACPDRVEDLEWLSQGDPLCGAAQTLARNILKPKKREGRHEVGKVKGR